MSVFVIFAFVICPIFSLPFLIIGLKKDGKHRKIYLAILAIFLALFSYCYNPTPSEDLSRHHHDVKYYEDKDVDNLKEKLSSRPEQISTIYKYLIGKTGNPDLLQFFTSIICFYILLFLLSEYTSKNKNVRGWKLVGIWFFVISGFHFVEITSGIFYTLSMEIFSLAVYLDYVYDKKIIAVFLYIATLFIHTCAVLPFAVLILYKILGSKITIKNIIALSVLIMMIGFLLMVVAPNVDLPIMTELSNMYKWYFNNEETWAEAHALPFMILHLSRLAPVFIAYKMSHIKDGISDFSIFISVAVIILYFQTSFSIRYIHVAVLCGIPMLFMAADGKRYSKEFCCSLFVFAVPHFIFQLRQFTSLGYFDGLDKIFVTNLITMLSGGGA